MHYKYIIIETPEGLEIPIIFGSLLEHKFVWSAVRREQLLRDEGPYDLVSAGFVQFHDKTPICYGRSDSMEIESLPYHDVRVIKESYTNAI